MRLVIKNWLESEDKLYEYTYNRTTNEREKRRIIKSYDEEKWRDGSVYEFNTLKEMGDFIETCDIDFTEEYEETFTEWMWENVNIVYCIDLSEEDTMILHISSNRECIG